MKIIKIIVSGYRGLEDNFTIDFLSLNSKKYPRNDNEMIKVFSRIRTPICHVFTGRHGSGKSTVLSLIDFCYELISNRRVTFRKLDFNKEVINLSLYIAHNEIMYLYKCDIYPPQISTFKSIYCRVKRCALLYKRIKLFHPKNFYSGCFHIFDESNLASLEDKLYFYIDGNMSKIDMLMKIVKYYQFIDNNLLLNFIKIFEPTITRFKLSEDKVHFFLKFDHEVLKFNIVELAAFLSSGTIKGTLLYMLSYFAISLGTILIVDDIDVYIKTSIAKSIIGLFNNPNINIKGAQIFYSTLSEELIDVLLRAESIHIMNKVNSFITTQTLSESYNFPIKGTRSKSKLCAMIDLDSNGDYEIVFETIKKLCF